MVTGPDLEGSDLSGMNLNEADLRGVDLSQSELSGAELSGSDLTESNLSGAALNWANLTMANLSRANMSGVNLLEAKLREANLDGAKLNMAYLGGADFSNSDLTETDLSEANLIRANLSAANLMSSNLYMAILEETNLKDADLRYCRLIGARIYRALFTGAALYGTSRDNWQIKDIRCDYVYWDLLRQERSPKDRDLEPGEFERLYAALPTIEYIFENGMTPIDPLIMDRVVQAIRERKPEFDIKIDSINARGLAPSIKFTVQHEEHKEPALKEVRREHEAKLRQLESERDRYWEVIKSAFDKPREVKLIAAGPGAIVATDGSTINIQQHIHNALELQKAIVQEPEESESFAKVAKKTALDIIGGAIKDIAKGQVKEAAKQIVELGKDLGPIIARTAAYAFFSDIGT